MNQRGKRGICCSCQSTHPVRLMELPSKLAMMAKVDMEEIDYNYQFGEAGEHVMLPHRIFGDTGPECEGAGQIPQTLVNE